MADSRYANDQGTAWRAPAQTHATQRLLMTSNDKSPPCTMKKPSIAVKTIKILRIITPPLRTMTQYRSK